MYYQGVGVDTDYKEAVKWYSLAAKQGDAEAQYNLGLMYDFGEGVLEDDVLAYMWYNICTTADIHLADFKKVEAKTEMEAIAKNLTSDQIAQALELSKQCLDSNYKDCD